MYAIFFINQNHQKCALILPKKKMIEQQRGISAIRDKFIYLSNKDNKRVE